MQAVGLKEKLETALCEDPIASGIGDVKGGTSIKGRAGITGFGEKMPAVGLSRDSTGFSIKGVESTSNRRSDWAVISGGEA